MSLEVNDDVSTEMEPSTTAPDVQVDAPASADPSQVVDQAVAAPATTPVAEPVVPAYTPSFKYSVRGQEKEIPEKYRALVKAAEDEKELKELFEKAEGLDFVKQDRSSLKQEYEGFKSQAIPYLQEYHKFTSLRDKGNLGAALQVAGISNEQIFEYAHQLLQVSENPQMAQLWENNQKATLRELEDHGKIQQFEMREQQLQVQQMNFNIDQSISGHKDLVSQIEAKWGQPGSFREEVIQYGVAQFQRGVQLSEEEAVEAVINKYKPFLMPSTPSVQAPVPHQAPATMPIVGGTNVSAIKKKPASIDDLKKAYREEVG